MKHGIVFISTGAGLFASTVVNNSQHSFVSTNIFGTFWDWVFHVMLCNFHHLLLQSSHEKKPGCLIGMLIILLVVSTHPKNMSQNGNLPQVGVKIKKSNHNLEMVYEIIPM